MDSDSLSIRDGKKDCGAAPGGPAKRKEKELDTDPGSTVSALAPSLKAGKESRENSRCFQLFLF